MNSTIAVKMTAAQVRIKANLSTDLKIIIGVRLTVSNLMPF